LGTKERNARRENRKVKGVIDNSEVNPVSLYTELHATKISPPSLVATMAV